MSALNNGISGLNAASTQLDSISNNIANANTTGFKSKSVQFADVFSSTGVGGGVYVSDVSTDYAQGALNATSDVMDMAIQGNGFFITEDASGNTYYTRAGNFEMDKDGNIVNSQGLNVQGYAVNENGMAIPNLTDIVIDTGIQQSQETTSIDINANLDARTKVIDTSDASYSFDPKDQTTYTSTTTTIVYDQQGSTHSVSAFYVKSGDNTWDVHYQADSEDLPSSSVQLEFDTTGVLSHSYSIVPAVPGTPAIPGVPAHRGTEHVNADGLATPGKYSIAFDTGDTGPTSGAGRLSFAADVTGISQNGNDFNVNSNTADGYTSGSYTGITISEDGGIYATYSNGQTQLQGIVAVATFPNQGALTDAGDTSWKSTIESGDAIAGIPGRGGAGSIKSKRLEASNVDNTAELVDMVVAQSTYQANAKSISAANQMTQVLMNAV